MSQLNGTVNRLNLTSKNKNKKQPAKQITTADKRKVATVVMGCGIPALSLSLSYAGGQLAHNELYGLAISAFAVMACVLLVSLSHLAEAIEDITRSHPFLSWLLAIAFDCALVLGELTHVWGSKANIGVVMWVMMGAVCLVSMYLNCWAFLMPKHKAK